MELGDTIADQSGRVFKLLEVTNPEQESISDIKFGSDEFPNSPVQIGDHVNFPIAPASMYGRLGNIKFRRIA